MHHQAFSAPSPAVDIARWIFRLALCLLLAAPAGAAELPQATAEELGLLLPQAPPQPGADRHVLLSDAAGALTVGQVYVEVGDRYVVLLPNGQLVAVPISETTPTDRPFEPISKRRLADELTAERFRGFRTRTTKRYLYVYNSSDAFADATSRILETMYPGLFHYCRRKQIEVRDPQFPLVVIIFRTQDEFDGYRQMPPDLVAYYNAISNQIVMYEQSRLAEIAPELAFKQAISTIAHEGVHQILNNIGVQQRLSRWPSWFGEGLAEYFAPTDLGRGVRWKGVGLVNDLRLHELSEFYRAQQSSSTDGRLIRQTVESDRLNSLGYATSWALIHYFARYERDALQSYLRDASRLGPLESVVPGSLFAEHFGTDYQQLETSLIQHLKSLPYVDPVANQTHFVLMIGGARREVLVTASPRKLQEFQRHKVRGRSFQIQALPNRSAAELFARRWLESP